MKELLLLMGLLTYPVMATAAVPMPEIVVLIVCKTVITGEPDDNAKFTGWQNREWAYEHSMMVCRRQEVSVYDPDVDRGADPQPFTVPACQRASMMLGPAFDVAHPNSKYRFWRAACPVPMMNTMGTEDTKDDEIVGWVLPDCGHRDTVVCESDTAI